MKILTISSISKRYFIVSMAIPLMHRGDFDAAVKNILLKFLYDNNNSMGVYSLGYLVIFDSTEPQMC
jgi:hypothetical protein